MSTHTFSWEKAAYAIDKYNNCLEIIRTYKGWVELNILGHATLCRAEDVLKWAAVYDKYDNLLHQYKREDL